MAMFGYSELKYQISVVVIKCKGGGPPSVNVIPNPKYSNGDGGSDHINDTTDLNGNSGGGAAGLAGLMEPRLFATMQRNLAANSDFLRQFQVRELFECAFHFCSNHIQVSNHSGLIFRFCNNI